MSYGKSKKSWDDWREELVARREEEMAAKAREREREREKREREQRKLDKIKARQALIKSIENRVKRLTPRGKVMLSVVLDIATQGDDITRQAIAQRLQRPKHLYPHDRKLLDKIVSLNLMSENHRALMDDDNMPHGYMKVYTMDKTVMTILDRARQAT